MSSNGTSSTPAPNGVPAVQGFEQQIPQAAEITAILDTQSLERRLFASQLDRAVDELDRLFASVPLGPLLARQGVFTFASPADHSDYVYFTSAFLDLQAQYSTIAALPSSDSTHPDAPPPAYLPNAPPNEKESALGGDPLTIKIARLLSSRGLYSTAKKHFLLLQHAQSTPGFTWASTDFIPARGISTSGTVMKEIATKMTELSNWFKYRLPLAESAYRLISPEPTFSAHVLQGILAEKPQDTPSQSAWMLQTGTLKATLDSICTLLARSNGGISVAEASRALGHLETLEINWVGTFMTETYADKVKNRRIHMANELVSLRLALLQAASDNEVPRMDLLST